MPKRIALVASLKLVSRLQRLQSMAEVSLR
jgi:hypothetical protein